MKIIKNIKTFIRFQIIGIKMGIRYDLENKTNFILSIILSPIWFLIQLIIFESIYSQTADFLGYTKDQSFFLVGIYTLINSIGYMFLYRKLSELIQLIKGDGRASFDMIVTKPIDSQIYATTGGFYVSQIPGFFLGLYLFLTGLSRLNLTFDPLRVLGFVILFIGGIIMFYLSYLLFVIIGFWTEISPDAVEGVWDAGSEISKYPGNVFNGLIRSVFTYLFPVLLMGTIPSDYLLGKVPLSSILFYILSLIIFFIISRFIWKISIKRYGSSGS